MGFEHAHYILANVLIAADTLNFLFLLLIFLASHDICRAFDSRIHAQLLVAAHKCGVEQLVILLFCNMYNKLSVQVKVPSRSGKIILCNFAPVRRRIQQGAISSPLWSNNSILDSQTSEKMSLIFWGNGQLNELCIYLIHLIRKYIPNTWKENKF
jgi:hypothetical protein